jgi:hypothetical protein
MDEGYRSTKPGGNMSTGFRFFCTGKDLISLAAQEGRNCQLIIVVSLFGRDLWLWRGSTWLHLRLGASQRRLLARNWRWFFTTSQSNIS